MPQPEVLSTDRTRTLREPRTFPPIADSGRQEARSWNREDFLTELLRCAVQWSTETSGRLAPTFSSHRHTSTSPGGYDVRGLFQMAIKLADCPGPRRASALFGG